MIQDINEVNSMSHIAIKDLVENEALDREALGRIHGGAQSLQDLATHRYWQAGPSIPRYEAPGLRRSYPGSIEGDTEAFRGIPMNGDYDFIGDMLAIPGPRPIPLYAE